jgi:hypothetical protein
LKAQIKDVKFKLNVEFEIAQGHLGLKEYHAKLKDTQKSMK